MPPKKSVATKKMTTRRNNVRGEGSGILVNNPDFDDSIDKTFGKNDLKLPSLVRESDAPISEDIIDENEGKVAPSILTNISGGEKYIVDPDNNDEESADEGDVQENQDNMNIDNEENVSEDAEADDMEDDKIHALRDSEDDNDYVEVDYDESEKTVSKDKGIQEQKLMYQKEARKNIEKLNVSLKSALKVSKPANEVTEEERFFQKLTTEQKEKFLQRIKIKDVLRENLLHSGRNITELEYDLMCDYVQKTRAVPEVALGYLDGLKDNVCNYFFKAEEGMTKGVERLQLENREFKLQLNRLESCLTSLMSYQTKEGRQAIEKYSKVGTDQPNEIKVVKKVTGVSGSNLQKLKLAGKEGAKKSNPYAGVFDPKENEDKQLQIVAPSSSKKKSKDSEAHGINLIEVPRQPVVEQRNTSTRIKESKKVVSKVALPDFEDWDYETFLNIVIIGEHEIAAMMGLEDKDQIDQDVVMDIFKMHSEETWIKAVNSRNDKMRLRVAICNTMSKSKKVSDDEKVTKRTRK
ncbi:TPA_asm: protein 2 [Leucanthemum virus 1]|uniref:Protein 2 n=1 Tax=Leucanthemum virus 1 TaxID=2977970 RepID=A0A9N6YJB4_9RHAB|nr:TPA_asm: protein 2 [Leucanthemum virus 1]